MRRALTLAITASLVLAGTAYAAVTVTNQYVLSGKISPKKGGTKKHPVPIASNIVVTTSTSPSGYRPYGVQKFKLSVQDISENTTKFPKCSSGQILNAANTCPSGSKIGTGYLIAEAGSSSNQQQVALTCSAQVSIYNGGNHTLTLYVYAGTPGSGQPSACPLTKSYAINTSLSRSGKNLVEAFSVPSQVLHPVSGYDAAISKASFTIPVEKKTVKKHGKKSTIGLFESVGCPASKKRHVAMTFTLENGTSQTATKDVACTK